MLSPPRTMSREEIVSSYRKLYRSALRAVQYSTPARFVVRDQLRRAFRERGAVFDADGARRTVWFLNAAAQEKGLEHKIVKSLLRTAFDRYQPVHWSRLTRMNPKAPSVQCRQTEELLQTERAAGRLTARPPETRSARRRTGTTT